MHCLNSFTAHFMLSARGAEGGGWRVEGGQLKHERTKYQNLTSREYLFCESEEFLLKNSVVEVGLNASKKSVSLRSEHEEINTPVQIIVFH